MTGKTCLVTGCTSNYHSSGDKSYITVTPFPADTDMHCKWLRAISRKDWLPSKRLVVCAKQFEANTFTDVMGNEQKNQRTRPKLRHHTVPRISTNLTHYLSKASKYDSRKDPNKIILQWEEDRRKHNEECLAEDVIKSFTDQIGIMLVLNNVMKQPWGKWEFSPQLRDALEKFEKTCLETEPLPEECASKVPQVYWKDKVAHHPQDSSLEQMDVDVEEPCEHEVTEPACQPSQMSQSTQSLAVQDIIQALEDGKLNPECLKELPTKTIKKFLPVISDCAVLHTSEIICKLRNAELAILMCTDVFLPWLSDTTRSCSRSIIEAMKQLTSEFPAEASTHLLGPLIIGTVDHQQIISPIIGTLAPEYKITVIRAVVESASLQLTEWQATLLQVAIVPSSDEILNEKIITLLLRSGSGLSSSAKFGQLLITVIQKIGPSLSINKREYLAAVLAEHKTVARKIGEKALKALN